MVFGRHYTKYYFKYFITFLIGIAALVLVDIYQLRLPNLVGELIDAIHAGEMGIEGAMDRALLIDFVKQLLIILIIVFIGRFVWRICIFGNGVKIETDIRNEMFEHMEKLSTSYFSKNKTGAIMALYTNDLSLIRRSFAGGTLMFVDALTLGVIAFTKMVSMSWEFTLVGFVPLALVALFAGIMRKRISKKVKLNLEAYSKLSDFVQEDYSGLSVVKAFVREKRQAFLFGKHNEYDLDTAYRFVKDQTLVQVVVNIVINIGMYGVVFLGGLLMYYIQRDVLDLDLTLGNLITFNSLLGALVWPLMAIGDLINLRGQSKAAEKRIAELLDQEVEINDEKVHDFHLKPSEVVGEIEFKHLTFKYPNSKYESLKDISFKINPGEMVGILGATGCGKSTVVELLLRLYNIDEETIFIDNNDIMKMPIKFVRDIIAYVPQESFLFKQTVNENIAFSLPEVDTVLTKEAAINAGIDKDITEFVNGYDTLIGERGVTVSGGQKQRISIARALIKNSPILILDDSLSAVDTITEEYILKSLRNIRKGKTTIIIAHRITTLETLDKIIVMDDGKINQVGTHEELLKSCDIYIREYELQELEKEEGAA